MKRKKPYNLFILSNTLYIFSQFLDCQASKVNNEMWASHQYIVGKIFFIRMIVLFSNLQLSTIFRCRCPFFVWWCESKELTIGLRSAFLMHQWCTCNLFIRQVKKTCSLIFSSSLFRHIASKTWIQWSWRWWFFLLLSLSFSVSENSAIYEEQCVAKIIFFLVEHVRMKIGFE